MAVQVSRHFRKVIQAGWGVEWGVGQGEEGNLSLLWKSVLGAGSKTFRDCGWAGALILGRSRDGGWGVSRCAAGSNTICVRYRYVDVANVRDWSLLSVAVWLFQWKNLMLVVDILQVLTRLAHSNRQNNDKWLYQYVDLRNAANSLHSLCVS